MNNKVGVRGPFLFTVPLGGPGPTVYDVALLFFNGLPLHNLKNLCNPPGSSNVYINDDELSETLPSDAESRRMA